MNSDENNTNPVVNDEKNNSSEQQHLVEPTVDVNKNDDDSAAPNAESEQAATDSAQNKSEVAQAKKNFMDRNKILLFSDEQKLSQKIGFAINRVKAGEVITVEAFGNSISRGITMSSIVRDRLAEDDNEKKEVYIQTSFISRTNEKSGKSYSGMQFKLSADKDKLDQECVGFQKPGDELQHLRASPRSNTTRPRNRQRRSGNDVNNSSLRRRSASQNKKSTSKLEADSKRDKSASNRRSKSTQKTNQQNQSKSRDEKSQSRKRSNSRRKTDNNPAPPAANDINQSVEKRRQQRRQRRNNNKSQDKDGAASNAQKQNSRNQADRKTDSNQRGGQRRNRSRSQRKQNQIEQERPVQQNNQRPRRQRNGQRPDQEAAPPSSRSYRSNQYDELPPRQQQYNRRSARPENQRPDHQNYPANGRPYAGYGRRGGYGQLPEPPRFTQKQSMNQSIFSSGSYIQQQRHQGPRPGYFPANHKDSRPGYFPANKDPRMPLNAPISDYRQQSAQQQYPVNGGGYGTRPMAHRYRDAEQRLPPQTVHQ